MTVSKAKERKVDKGARHRDKSRLVLEREANFAQSHFYTMLHFHPTEVIKMVS